MKVHVVLKDAAQAKVEEKSPESLKRYERRMKLRNADWHLLKYGIVTADIDSPDQVEWLENKRDVEAVEVNQVQKAI